MAETGNGKIAIIVAALGVFGTLGGAAIVNWDKLFPKAPSTNTNLSTPLATPINKSTPTPAVPTTITVAQRPIQTPAQTNATPSRRKPSKVEANPGTQVTVDPQTGTTQITIGTTIITITAPIRTELVQNGSTEAIHPQRVFPTAATIVIGGKEFVGTHLQAGDFTFPPIPCDTATGEKKVTFKVKYTSRSVFETEQSINCARPEIKIVLPNENER